MADGDDWQIVQVVNRFALAFDGHDWDVLRTLLSDEIEIDYRDLRGDPPSTVTAEEYVATRASNLNGLQMVHLFSSHVVDRDGDFANVRCAYQILRGRDGDHLDTAGHYVFGLRLQNATWKISSIRQSVARREGDPSIHGGAKRR